jgi:hypothetical protein
MVHISIQNGQLPLEVNRGMMVLLHKRGEKKFCLTNGLLHYLT